MCKGLVAYYRVSTEKQGRSGLGLDAQKKAVADYATSVGLPVTAVFEEIESGKQDDRPELEAAVTHCRLTSSRLVIAKLDRLSRNVGFIARLQESHVHFVCCDMPEANETMIQFMAVMAQAERKAISRRTMEALQAAKARGVKLGNPNIEKARAARKCGDDMSMATAVRTAKADKYALSVWEVITKLDPNRCGSLSMYASQLNNMGIETPRKKAWTRAAVKRVIDRIKRMGPTMVQSAPF